LSQPFSILISSEQLSRGLRPSSTVPRNSRYLITCTGAVGRDGVLQAIDELDRINTDAITDPFPFPQLFVFPNLIIVCGKTQIFELVGASLTLKLLVAAGSTWTAEAFGEFVYLSNGTVAVTRDPDSHIYSLSTTLPTASSICNFMGQVMVGAPGMALAGVGDYLDLEAGGYLDLEDDTPMELGGA